MVCGVRCGLWSWGPILHSRQPLNDLTQLHGPQLHAHLTHLYPEYWGAGEV